MDDNIVRETILIITGILNLGVAVYSLITVLKLPVLPGKPKYYKIILATAYFLYIILEGDWLTRGLYHASSWVPIVWNMLDGIWMLVIPNVAATQFCRPIKDDKPANYVSKADEQLQTIIARVVEATKK